MKEFQIGTDIEEIKRFENKDREKDKAFLDKIFTSNEIEYCYKSKNYAPHLCGRFCAKEAVVKALYGLNIKDVYYSDIEILNKKTGEPFVNLKKYSNLCIKISLSHCKSYATATAIIVKE